jgi:hypothetical protein
MAKNTENIRPKGVRIVLDRERHMRFSFAALEYLAEKYGDLHTAFSKMPTGGDGLGRESVAAIVDFTYAGLMHEDGSLTRDKVAEIIDISMVNEIASAIVESITGSLPAAKKAENGNPQ